MKLVNRFLLIGLVSFMGFANVANAGIINVLNKNNLIVFGDLDSNSEVEGRTLVGGSVVGEHFSNYGIHLPANSSTTDYALTVAGNISKAQVNSGYGVLIGGNYQTIKNANTIDKMASTGENVDFTKLEADFLDFSSFLQALAPNSYLSAPTVQPGPAHFNVTNHLNNGLSIFSFSQSSFFSNSRIQQYDMILGSHMPSSIIFNAAGKNISDTFLGNAVGNMVSELWRDKIIWNFFEAESINLTKQFNGSLLAPLAHLENRTPIEGTVVVKSFTQRGEVHLSSYAGHGLESYDIKKPSTVVSEPSIGLLVFLVAISLMSIRKNGRKF